VEVLQFALRASFTNNNNSSMVRHLLRLFEERQVDLNETLTYNNHAPLKQALGVKEQSIEMIELLFSIYEGCKIDVLKIMNTDNCISFFQPVEANNLKLVHFLFDRCEERVEIIQGGDLITKACAEGLFSMAKLFIDICLEKRIPLKEIVKEEWLFLYCAITHGNVQFLSFLLALYTEHGIDVKSKMEEKGHKLLLLAITNGGKVESLGCILKWYKEANLVDQAKDCLIEYISSSADILTHQTVLYLYKFFQEYEIDINPLLKNGLVNILVSAISADDLTALESLIKLFFQNHGFSLDASSTKSRQPLITAAQFGHIGILHYLLELYMESKNLNLKMLSLILTSQANSKASQLILASAEALGMGSRVELLHRLSDIQKFQRFKTRNDTEILSTIEKSGDEIICSAKGQRTFHKQIRNTIPFVKAFCAQTPDERVNLATVYRLGFFPLEIRTKIASFMLGQEIVIPDEIAGKFLKDGVDEINSRSKVANVMKSNR
jgi:hypothetical protein